MAEPPGWIADLYTHDTLDYLFLLAYNEYTDQAYSWSRAFRELGDRTLHLPTIYNTDLNIAMRAAEILRPQLCCKDVVDVGAGMGLFDLVLAYVARPRLLIALDHDPSFTLVYTYLQQLANKHGLNIQYMIAPVQVIGRKLDAAIVATYSGAEYMKKIASQVAEKVILLTAQAP